MSFAALIPSRLLVAARPASLAVLPSACLHAVRTPVAVPLPASFGYHHAIPTASSRAFCSPANESPARLDALDAIRKDSAETGRLQLSRRQRTQITNQLWVQRLMLSQREAKDPNRGHQVIEKSMKDSYFEVMLPFAEDRGLREEYVSVFPDTLRLGMLLEDCDAMAGSIAYKFCDDHDKTTRPLTIVTASVDHINILGRLSPNRNMRLWGHVTWVGRSSMEVVVRLDGQIGAGYAGTGSEQSTEAQDSNNWERLLVSYFTMVARDPFTGKAAMVNRLLLENDEEKRIFEVGAAHDKWRKEYARQALAVVPEAEEDRQAIEAMHQETLRYKSVGLPGHVVWMSNTVDASTRFCHPQNRNVHGKIFGGYLMRAAYELGFVSAAQFCRSYPTLVSQDQIFFRKPVDVGSILRFTSRVEASSGSPDPCFQVSVKAEVVDHATGAFDTTNTFHYLFQAPDNVPTRRVVPNTFGEYVAWMAARRRRRDLHPDHDVPP